jgi:hypothetical protein
MHLGLPQVLIQVALAGQVHHFDMIGVDQSQIGNAYRGKLQGNLPADGADPDDHRLARGQALSRHDVALARIAMRKDICHRDSL